MLAGDDLHHPAGASREVARRVPGAALVEWRKEPEHQQLAQEVVAALFAAHTPD